jgi:hypothetical protein
MSPSIAGVPAFVMSECANERPAEQLNCALRIQKRFQHSFNRLLASGKLCGDTSSLARHDACISANLYVITRT